MPKTREVVCYFMYMTRYICNCNCCRIIFSIKFYTGEGAQPLSRTHPQ